MKRLATIVPIRTFLEWPSKLPTIISRLLTWLEMMSWWCCHNATKWVHCQVPKKCDIGQHFWFCHIWVMWQRCVIHLQHMTADLVSFLFYFCNSFKLTNSNEKIMNVTHDHHSSLTVLWGGATKKLITTTKMAMEAAGHCSCNFSCSSPFWLLLLHQWVPPQATMLTCLILARGR